MEGGEDSEFTNPDLSFEDRGFLLAMRKGTRILDLKTFLPISLGIHLLFFSMAALISKEFQTAPLRVMPVEVSLFLPASQAIAEDRLPAKLVQVSPEKTPMEKRKRSKVSLLQEELTQDIRHPQPATFVLPVEEKATISQGAAERTSLGELKRLDQDRDEEDRMEASTETEVPVALPNPKILNEEAPSLLKENSSSGADLTPAVSYFLAPQSHGRTILESEAQEGSERLAKAGPSSAEAKLLVQPRYLRNPKPLYPEEARKKGYYGEVMLRVEVLPNGQVGQIELQRSSGYDLLDRSALGAVRQWRFLPAKKGETHVSSWVHVPIKFQLE
jgi:TonB family protein